MNPNTQSCCPNPATEQDHARHFRRQFTPAVDVVENNSEIVMSVDLPGVRPEDVEVSIERQLLRISGTAGSALPEGYQRTSGEWGSRVYERTFRVSDDLDRDHIDAQVQDGVLTLRLPKSQRAQRQAIPVRAVSGKVES